MVHGTFKQPMYFVSVTPSTPWDYSNGPWILKIIHLLYPMAILLQAMGRVNCHAPFPMGILQWDTVIGHLPYPHGHTPMVHMATYPGPWGLATLTYSAPWAWWKGPWDLMFGP